MERWAENLNNYSAQPPAQLWAQIEGKLNEGITWQQNLAQFEETPDAANWDFIKNKLDSTGGAISVFRSQWFRVAAALVLFAGGAWAVSRWAGNGDNKNLALQNEKPPVQAITPAPTPDQTTTDKGSVYKNTAGKSARYVTVAQGSKTVRRSKKVTPIFDCAALEKPTSIKDCKENLANLQRKMASSLVTPTGDFAGLIDMIKTVEQED